MAGVGMLSQMLAQQTLNSAAMAEAGKGNANDQAALALTKAVKDGLSTGCLANDACVLMAIVSAQNQQKAEEQSGPNLGKELSDGQKKELGGTGSGTPGGWGPEDEQQARDKNLSTSDQRSVKSLEEQIRVHEDKLEAYKKDPDSFDNKGYLQNAPNEQVRQRIIDGRIRHLEQEIRTFHKNIDEIKNSKG
ncbi:VENN motif pre-toxin domain-containing protein [Erwinia rhapontici]